MPQVSLNKNRNPTAAHGLPVSCQVGYGHLLRDLVEVGTTAWIGDGWALRIVSCLRGGLTHDNLQRARRIAQHLIDDGILIRRRSKGLKQRLIQRSGPEGYAHHMRTFNPHGIYRFVSLF